MNLQFLSNLVCVGFWVLIGLDILFLVFVPINRTNRVWHLFLPCVALLLYVPYELYFTIPDVLLSVPIRVDLLLIIPFFGISLFVSACTWGFVLRRKLKETEPRTGAVFSLIMTVMMAICTVGWPVYVATYL